VFGLGSSHVDLQLWLFIISIAALAGSVLLAARRTAGARRVSRGIATRWDPVRLFGRALALFVLGLLVTGIAGSRPPPI
jgi:hypothetical protein